MAQARKLGHAVVLPDSTTARNQVQANPNGTFTARLSAGPVRVKKAAGWQAIDPSLTRSAEGFGPKAALGGLSLPASGGASAFAQLHDGTQNLSLSLAGVSRLPAPQVSGPIATYRNVLPAADLQVRSLAAGLDAAVVLHNRPTTAPVYRFELRLGRLRLVKGAGQTIKLENAKGAVVGSSPGPLMWGAAMGAHTDMPTHEAAVPFAISRDGAVTVLTVSPPASFLSSPQITYPVTVDPSLTLSDIGDDYIDSGFATTNYGSNAELHAGTYDSGSNVDRDLLQFSTSGLPSGAKISSATLEAYEFWAWSCTPENVGVYQVTGAWHESTATWNNQPPIGSELASQTVAHGYNSSCPAAWVPFSVTSAVQSWVNGTANDGLEVRTNESNNFYWKKFYATNNGSNAPYITVTYTTTPSVPTGMAFSPDHGGDAESLAPTFSASFASPDRSSGHDAFHILNSAGTVVDSGMGTTVASGGRSTWTLSGPQLVVGQTYTVQAQAVAEGNVSAYSPAVSFSVDPRLTFGVNSWSTYVKVPLDQRTTAQVDVASGDLSVATPGLSLPGAQLPFNLSFWAHSSRTGASTDPGAIAANWTDNLSARLSSNADGSVTYFEPAGGTGTFTPNGSGGFNSPGPVNATLAAVSGGGWTLTFHFSGSTNIQGEVQTFNSSGQLVKEAAASGETNTITYTAGQPTQVTDTQGRVIKLAYDSSGNLTSVNDTASGRIWTISYLGGNISAITDPADHTTGFTVGANGDITGITSPAGRSLAISYNSALQVSAITKSGGAAPSWSFSYGNFTTSSTDPDGNSTTYAWDNANRVTKTTDALGQSRSTTWTSDNNVLSATDASSNVVAFTWNATTDVLQKVSMPTGASTSLTYGDTSNPYVPSKVTDPQGNSISYGYDADGQPQSATDSLSSQNQVTLTHQGEGGVSCGAQAGELCTVTNADGESTSYGYNSAGMLTSVTPPAPAGKTTYSYDADGNISQVTDGRGDTTNYTWDADDELTKVTPASGTAASYGYDADGDLTSRSGQAGTQTLTWDALDRLNTSTGPSGDQATYAYDASGNLTSLTDASGSTHYTYSKVNEPTGITDPWGGVTSLSYASGKDTELATITLPNGVAESFGYDNSNRITSLGATSGSTTLIKDGYSYTAAAGSDRALVQSATDMADDTTKYGYDAMNRLTSADTTSSSGSSVSSYGYGYDGVGNLTSATVNGTTTNYTYNGASELTSQGASYDGAGDFTGGAGFSALAYNAGGQTTSVTPSGGAAASLSYLDNNQNQLVQAGDTTLDENALGIARSTAAGATTDYVYDPSGRLVAEHTGGATYYYLLGNLGSVLGLTDSSGKLVNSYTYTPYGQQTAQSSSAPNLFGFDGGLEVPGSGLIHFGARYYDPKRGQWTQPDPTGQDPAYVYTQDDPANYTDLSGQSLLELLFDAQDILNEFKADSLEEQLRVLAGAAAGAVFGLACSSAVAAAEIPTAGLSTLGEGGCVLGSAEVDKLVSGS